MDIKLTEGEVIALNTMGENIQNAQAVLGRLNVAQQAQIKLLEIKYNAEFNPTTGKLEPKREEKVEEKKSKEK